MSTQRTSSGYVIFLFGICATLSNAAEIKVDSLDDSGSGSLRASIIGASPGDTVLLRAEGTITLESAIPVTRGIRIEGQGGPLAHTIAVNGNFRHFEVIGVPVNQTAVISRLTLDASGLEGNGGGISSDSYLELESLRIFGASSGGSGGAVSQTGGRLGIHKSCFSNNSTAGTGGAIYVDGADLTVTSTGFDGNTGAVSGGAIGFLGGSTNLLSVRNSTLNFNSANVSGGGVALLGGVGHGVNLTLVANTLVDGTPSHLDGGSGPFILANSLIEGSGSLPGVSGSVSEAGNNLAGSVEELGLGELADYGGVSPTYLLEPGSPAIDGGVNLSDPLLPEDDRDQRGLARFSDGDGDGEGDVVDVGAFEIQHYQVSALQIRGSATGGTDDGGYGNPFDPSDDADSIASADVFIKLTQTGKADIGDAVGANNAAGGGSVSFADKIVPGRTTLKGRELEIRRDLAIYGPGASSMVIDGNASSPVMRVGEGALAYVRGISIENGMAETGAGIVIDTGGRLELEEVAVSGNAATLAGGGIAVLSGDTYVFRSSLTGNTASLLGGAVYATTDSSVTIDTSTLSGNSAGSQGGAIAASGELTIDSSALVDNTAASAPGVYMDEGAGTLQNSIFASSGVDSIGTSATATVTSDGHNISDADAATLTGPMDQAGTDPQLEALALNGETSSHALQSTSPAINAGESLNPPQLDQPGNTRVRGGVIDVGPVEFQNDLPTVDCPLPASVDCISPSGASVDVETVVDDLDGDDLTVVWSSAGTILATDTVAGASLPYTLDRTFDFPPGESSLVIIASDALGSSSPCVVPIFVNDTTDPVVTLNGDADIVLECGVDSYVELGATATDDCDSNVTASITSSDLPTSTPYPKDSYTITYSATDDDGNTGTADRTISVVDTIAPVVTLNGPDTISLECNVDTYNELNATALDSCDGSRTVVVSGSVDTSIKGDYFITYTATDSEGLVGTAERKVTVVDTTKPVVTLNGDAEITLECGLQVYTEPGATALDACDGSIPVAISGTVDTSTKGDYTITYTATDGEGLVGTATRMVTIVDTTAPVVSLNGAASITLECGIQTYTELNATALDACDGSLSVVVSGTVDTGTKGAYTVTYTATDGEGLVGTATRTVTVVDTTPPVVTLIGASDITLECGIDTYTEFNATASDACDGSLTVVISGTVNTGSKGEYTVTYTATDGEGLVDIKTRNVTVVDTTPPVVTLNGAAAITLECGIDTYTEFNATASDACDGFISVVISGTVDTSTTGNYIIAYTATDGEGLVGTATRTVTVVDTTLPQFTSEPSDATILTDAGYCFGTHEFAATATDNCTTDPAVQFFIDEIEITSPHRFELGSTLVDYTAEDPSGNSVSGTFLVTVEDPYQNCAFNVAWPAALEPQFQQGEGFSSFSTQQLLGLTDQSRWYKFNVLPGSRVTIILSEVPANYDIVVYRDIQAEFERLLALFNSTDPEEQELSLLGAEFAPESFTPESFIAESFSPENYSPESFIPESFIPESFIPESFIPESFIPESFIPESFIPESFIADSYSPESFIPESFIPESFIPESFIPESFIPESFIGENFTPESFIAAQLSSMIAYSAFPGVVSEGVSINTYTLEGDFYVRVRGANGVYDGENPFTISVFIEEDICGDPDGEGPLTGVQGPESFPDVDPVGEPGNYQTVILWDSARTPGTVEELEALEAKLEEFAPEVAGAVIDLALEDRVLAANIQADDFPTCPYAKNLVAEETKAVIDAWRSANSTTLQYVLLLGNDEAIPFFRTTDEAFLANESNYVPPVQNNNHSQSSLRYGQILTQDPYGSDCIINLSTGPYPYADLAVGRLVESAADMTAQMDNYLALTGGILAGPSSALVTGYDFLDDLANAIEFELETALGSQIDTLIDAATTAPADGWSASELADIFLGVRHDIVFLAGHFSTGSSLAADYQTRLTASQVLQSGADLLNTLIFSVGCHSGYNTVDEHAINGFTKQPDWAQAFGQMGATFIAGTGYQYGDTEFIEYSERLYLEVVRQLRTGTGPVSIGDALVQAKRKYLAETPLMRGIHEKSLLQATLFGFPMLKIDVPGARIGSGGGVTNLGMAPGLVINNPGKVLGLATQDVTLPNTVQPLVEKSLTLTIPNDPTTPDDDEPIVAYWFEGNNGIVSNPAEPVRPLDSYNVSAAGNLLRGVGFRGGSYDDIDGFLPLTGAPTTEIRGVFGNFVSDVYYPVQPYSTNYFGTICGGTDGERLNVYRTQFYGPDDGVLGGTMRKYQSMDFRLFYNNNRETYYNIYGHAIIPALTAPPTISRVVSSTDGTVVDFDVTVLTSPAVGIQEVWVTYTGIPGSSLHGTWQSEDLTQGALPDTMIWSGSLPLPVGVQSDELRFMVQAASGIGLVTLKTNYGQYYEVGVDDLAARIETEIAFIDPVPAASSYGESVTVKAVLTAPGEGPLANKRVGFRIGASRVTGLTNGLGELTLELPVTVRPATDLLQAYFLGDTDYAPSAISQQFVISKQNTFLSWDEGIPGPPTKIFGNEVVVSLRDALGTPLKERTVFFLVDYGTFELGNSVITDIAGRADLSELFLPAGSATITAYYNGEITLPGGEVVNIDDVRYNPAFTSPSLDVIFAQPIQEDSLGFDPQQVDVYYKSSGNGRNTPAPIYENASISGDVAFNVPLQPADLLANDPDPDFIEAAVEVRLAGQLIAFDDEILLDTRGDNGNHWTTASRPGKEVSYVGIHWSNAPRFDTALSGSAGPRIYTLFIGNSFTEFRYEPAGMKEVVTDFPGGISIIVNKDGEVDPSSPGLISGSYAIDAEGITFDARIGLEPGMELVTRDNSKGPNPFPDIVVPVVDGVLVPETPEAPINYLTEGGRMIIRLAAMEATPRPGSDATPNLFECRFRLGNTGPGEGGEEQFQVRSIARIGEGLYAIPWSSEDPGHKQYRP